ncbi:MAG: hypothetical protein ACKVX7_04900 [Planctomycetota bacterium]
MTARGYVLLEVSLAISIAVLALLPMQSALARLLIRLAVLERRQELVERLETMRATLEFRGDQVATADAAATVCRGDVTGSSWQPLRGAPCARFNGLSFQYRLKWIEGAECDWVLLVGRVDETRVTIARARPKP